MMTHGELNGNASRHLITIVDDDGSVRDSIQSFIRSVGFKARVFASAEDLLGSDALDHTSCLIVDVRMPGMSGLELQNRLNQSQISTPIIFITAHFDEKTRTQAVQAGAVEFLRKPFSEDELLHAIDLALQKEKEN
jgi:two-component system response regulator FixJ